MRRCRPINSAFVFALCVVLGACEPSAPPEIPGGLYFGSGNYLALMELRDGSTDIVASIGDSEILEISPKDDRRLLLNVFGPVNQKNSHRLVLFDLETRQQLTFFEGRFGRYLMDGNTLVYDDGSRIWATWKRVNYWEKVEVAKHPFNAKVSIIPIADNAFLYSSGPGSDAPAYVFNTVDRTSTELAALSAVCGLEGAIWVAARSELLCLAGSSYVFVNLAGEVSGSLQLPPGKSFRALAYLPDRNNVVLSERWQTWMSRRQKWAVWIYDIETANPYRLLEHQFLGRTVIYLPD